MIDEVRVLSVTTEMFVPLDEQLSKRYKSLRALFWPPLGRHIPLMHTFGVEVILDNECVERLLNTECHVLWTLVLESEVEEADRPTWITVIDRHQVLLELFHSLGQKPSCSMMMLRMLLRHLVVLG